MRTRSLPLYGLLVIGGLIVVFLSLRIGPLDVSYAELLNILTQQVATGVNYRAVWQFRVPRALGTFLVGGTLSISGLALQGLFRNPLAAPGIIGVSSGGAFGAIVMILLGFQRASLVTTGAFVVALITVWGVYRLATRHGRTPVTSLLLAGLAVGAFYSAMIGLAMTLVNPFHMNRLLFWLLGGLEGIRWTNLGASLGPFVIGSVGIFYEARAYDLLSQGEASARSMGVNVRWVKIRSLIWVTLLTATAVALTGVVGFVGLMVPHVARMFLGPRHRTLYPAVFLGGGLFLIAADALARWIAQPVEIRIGIVTALAGAPFFLYILRRRTAGWGRKG